MNTPSSTNRLSDCDVYVIAGGLGTRIQPVLGDTPKLLAPVGGRPYLEFLLEWLRGFGIGRVVLGLGHRAESILGYLQDHPMKDLQVEAVVEPSPLGTAGALRLARSRLRSDPVMVMNGDGIVECDLNEFFDFHRATRAGGTILVASVDDARRFGRIETDNDMIVRFLEKDALISGRARVNAGIYLLNASLLDEIAAGEARSLEYDVFARLPARTLAAFSASGNFIDIGTPEMLALANRAKSKNQ
jgi:NDP-sugar pyrophosphorylase family protein